MPMARQSKHLLGADGDNGHALTTTFPEPAEGQARSGSGFRPALAVDLASWGILAIIRAIAERQG